MDRTELIQRVEEDTWTARMNARYHELLIARWQRIDTLLRVAIAVVATLTAASPALGNLGVSGPAGAAITSVLSILVALISGYTLVAPPSRHVNLNTALRGRWVDLRYDFERLLASLRQSASQAAPTPLVEEHKRLLDRHRDISRAQPPAERELLEEAQEQVLVELGLKPPPEKKPKLLGSGKPQQAIP